MRRSGTQRPKIPSTAPAGPWPGWKQRVILAAAAVLVGGLACGEDSTGPPPPPPPPPPVATTVAVTPAAAELSAIGETVQLSAEVRDQNGRAMPGASVAWASSDVAVVAVDGSGLATAAGNGTATVTAASGSASGTATVTVEQSVTAVAITPDSALVLVGDTLRLSAVPVDALGATVEGAAVAWASGDTLVATVDSSGLATGIATGAAEITATSSGVEGRARLVVADAAPTTVTVTPDSASLRALGDTARLSAEVFDQIGRPLPGAAIRWSSADPAVASVDSTGLVRAEDSGATTVTASSGSASGSASVSVMQSASSVTVTPAEATIGPGDTLRLMAEAFDANAHAVAGAEFSWSSSDGSVATVDASGLVRGVAEGNATITAAAGDAPGTSEITVANPDRAALVALYEATDGPNWVNSENWLTDAPLGEWYGVTTDPSGRVVGLNLAGRFDRDARRWIRHGLSGPIPLELSNLAKIQELQLYYNNLSGFIPPELGTLVNLVTLEIGQNLLSGPIPREFGNLTNLKWLTLSRNNLSGSIPLELSNLLNLERLTLSYNSLSGRIPSELGDLANLTLLDLQSNALSGTIPPELGNLAKLQVMAFGTNNLTGRIPPELGNLTNLTLLAFGANDLEGPIPRSLLALPLRDFLWDCGSNAVCVPGSLEFVKWVDGLEVRSGPYCNEFDRAAMTNLFEWTGGDAWTESDGWLEGAVLEEWHGVQTDSLGRVTVLDLNDNGLSGALPDVFGALTQLAEIRLDGNPLGGRLPLSLTRLDLRQFDYGDTELCEPSDPGFRAWLSGIASHRGTNIECEPLTDREVLTRLYEATDGPNWDNDLNWLSDAPIGDWYGVQVNDRGRVVHLHLPFNGLSGAIPPELGSLAGLKELNLQWNNLRGPIPAELGALGELSWLGLEGNDLSGPIPPALGGLANLAILRLHWNGLTGAIPPELGNLARLEELNLTSSGLSGRIPPELGHLVNLWGLHLSENDLSGPIPPELGGLPNLGALNLADNGLTGSIPRELGNLNNLRLMSLGGNELSGPIPHDLGHLAKLESLFLELNDLTGPIPPELGGLTSLRELNLTGNGGLAGALPGGFVGLRLESLFAGNTDLCVPREAALEVWLRSIAKRRIARCGGALAYLTQAVQSRSHPVPLVAGEEALLRVFVTAVQGSSTGMPPVRAKFYANETETHAVDVPGTSITIPAEIDEGDLSKSANAVIPAEVVRPGLEMVIDVDPNGTLDASLGVVDRIPATGRLAVEVRELPVFDLTVIPFLWAAEPDSAVIGQTRSIAADPEGHELLQATRTLLPVADIDARAHAPVTTSSNSGFNVLRETEALRILEGGGGHYVGRMADFSDVAGVAYLGGRSSVSMMSPTIARQASVIAHEFGHNMNLSHAPCGGAGNPDRSFPYPDGRIGAWGYGFRTANLVHPSFPDLMGYCGPTEWISDYHFTNALGHRLQDEGAGGAPAATRSILVWGGVDAEGVPFLDPSFVVDAPVALPDSAGAYAVTGRDAGGGELFSLSFAMPVLADAEGASSFVFAVPAEAAWEGRLASVTLSGPSGAVVLDGETNRPMAILRDPASGQVRGFFSELSQDVGTAAAAAAAIDAEPGLRVLFSRGIPDAAAWRR